MLAFLSFRADARAVDLEGPNVYEGRPMFGIKHKSHCLLKRKIVEWGGGACQLGLVPGLLSLDSDEQY